MKNFYVIIVLMVSPNLLAVVDLQSKSLRQKKAFESAQRNNWNQVLEWAAQGSINIDELENGHSLLTMAVFRRNEDVIEQLIKLGANVNHGMPTPLTSALVHISMIDESFEHKTRLTETGLRIIRTLVQHGATPSERDFDLLKRVPDPLRTQIMGILSREPEVIPAVQQPNLEPETSWSSEQPATDASVSKLAIQALDQVSTSVPTPSIATTPEPSLCTEGIYVDWANRVKKQEGLTCGYHAVWNMAQILNYLKTKNLAQANQLLRQGPPFLEWQNIIKELHNISDQDIETLAFQAQGLNRAEVTIIPNINEWSPALDDSFAEIAEKLQNRPGAIHGFILGTAGHTTNEKMHKTTCGHWVAAVAFNNEGVINLHIADSLSGGFSYKKAAKRLYMWLTTPPTILIALARIPNLMETAGNVLSQNNDLIGAQQRLNEIEEIIIQTPGLTASRYFETKIKPQLEDLKNSIERFR